MKRWGKWMAGLLGLIVLLLAGAAVVGKQLAEQKRARQVAVAVQPVLVPTDTASIERGRYLYLSRSCAECHGADGGGMTFVNDGKGTRIVGPNISPGPGNVVGSYRPEDWVRAIRHGVKPDGRPLFAMPSEEYNQLTDADLGALVAYLLSLPPASGGAAVFELPLPVQVLYGFGVIPDAAQIIDHARPPATPVPAAVTVEHGAYVANMCIGCHGPGLSGGKIPGGPPDWPHAANLTPGTGSVMPRYQDAAQFIAMLRSGKRPDGSAIQVMPFGALRELSDVDAQALYAYLHTVPAKPHGER
ncbi:MAG TPA: c-type cytochrome [Burkholderiaceae bacterium]|nr:c-type cytochrome [Burkholderiaceae bacterium]